MKAVECDGVELDPETIERARDTMRRAIAHLPPEEQAQYLESFEVQMREKLGSSLEKASADSCIEVLRSFVKDLEKVVDAIFSIAKNADHGPMRKGPVVFLLGEASGAVTLARATLEGAASNIEKAMETLGNMRAYESGEKKPDKTEH